jgi:hypothetical protein
MPTGDIFASRLTFYALTLEDVLGTLIWEYRILGKNYRFAK